MKGLKRSKNGFKYVIYEWPLRNVGFAKARHMRMFYHAANWLVESQNQETGAWHVNVPFNLKKSKYPYAEEMGPGWISAMGSAHAMSVLTRAFRHSGKSLKYDFLQKISKKLNLNFIR